MSAELAARCFMQLLRDKQANHTPSKLRGGHRADQHHVGIADAVRQQGSEGAQLLYDPYDISSSAGRSPRVSYDGFAPLRIGDPSNIPPYLRRPWRQPWRYDMRK